MDAQCISPVLSITLGAASAVVEDVEYASVAQYRQESDIAHTHAP